MSRANGNAIKKQYARLLERSPSTDDEIARLIFRLSGLEVEKRTIYRWRVGETTPPEAVIALLNLRRHLTLADLDKASETIANENRELAD